MKNGIHGQTLFVKYELCLRNENFSGSNQLPESADLGGKGETQDGRQDEEGLFTQPA